MDEFSFDNLARWIVAPISDPIAFDNWVGNFLLGIKVDANREWEKAVAIEKLRSTKESYEGEQSIKNWLQDNNEKWSDTEKVQIILDGFEPAGVVALEGLGTIISPVGKVLHPDKTAMEISLDMTGSDKQNAKIPVDDIKIFPIPKNTAVKINIHLKEGLKLDKKSDLAYEVTGGRVGLIIDSRGRPMSLPTPDVSGRLRLEKWQKVWA